MSRPDLNLLVTLDVLLTEGSVAGAARVLRLSPSAMSRALARLRAATGDPLLVRSGRGLVPTPRALALRERVGAVLLEADALLRPAEALDLAGLARTFVLRTGDGFVESFGPALIARVAGAAPSVRLRFVPKAERDDGALRDGTVDLETGVVAETAGPELRTQALFRDRLVGVVRSGHPLIQGDITAARYVAARHVEAARHAPPTDGRAAAYPGPIEAALAAAGLTRAVAVVVAGFASALALARSSDLVATVPERHSAALRDGLVTFPLPFAVPDVAVAMLWHPRVDADPAHRWLRGCVRDVCAPGRGADTGTLGEPLTGRYSRPRTNGIPDGETAR